MIDLEKILRENPNGVLATRNGDGVATRIFQFLFINKKRLIPKFYRN